MKKRFLKCLICCVMAVALILGCFYEFPVGGLRAGDYTVPTELTWSTTSGEMGKVSFRINDPTRCYYFLRLYMNGNRRATYGLGDLSYRNGDYYTTQLYTSIDSTGTYSFEVCMSDDDSEEKKSQAKISARSADFNYDDSGTTPLPTPTNPRWDNTRDGYAMWDPVAPESAVYYYGASLYDDAGRFIVSVGSYNTSVDLSDYLANTDTTGYRFKVTAYSRDIEHYQKSAASGMSGFYTPSIETMSAGDAINQTLRNVSSGGFGPNVDALKNAYSTDDRKETMKSAIIGSESVQDTIRSLESGYAAEKGITVNPPVSQVPEVAASEISVVGAGLSATAGSTIGLTVTPVTRSREYDTDIYTNALSFNMSLFEEDGRRRSEITTLDIPVVITLPVPTSIAADRLFILHFLSDGSFERITPVITPDGRHARFCIYHFSDFMMVEQKQSSGNTPSNPPATDNTDNGNRNDQGNQNNGGSSSGTTPSGRSSTGSSASDNTNTVKTKPIKYRDVPGDPYTVLIDHGVSTNTDVVILTNFMVKVGDTVMVKNDDTGITSAYKISPSGGVSYFAEDVPDDVDVVRVPDTITINDCKHPVTRVGNSAFYGNDNIRVVKVGENVRSIGRDAFRDCKNLKRVILPSSLVKIRERAFYGNDRLMLIEIESSDLKSIGKKAFFKIGDNATVDIEADGKEYKSIVSRIKKSGLSGEMKFESY